jgi:DNA-cytosine methyltransferase
LLKHLDLFSGIGGFSLGLEATGGFETVAFCDVEEFPRKVLQKHWPDVKQYKDIKELTYEKLKADGIDTIDIITGGYPCQPFSVAGRKKGEEDPRHLWPEYFRLVKECRPTWVIGENVGGHIKLGLDTVLENLESEGYAVRTFSIPASAVGANHKRERVWIVGYSEYNGSLANEIKRSNNQNDARGQEGTNSTLQSKGTSGSRDSSNVENTRRSLWQRSELQRQNENEIGEGNANQSERSSSSSKSDVANTNINGLERRLSEVSNKADAGKDTPQLRRESSNKIIGQSNDGGDRKESRINEDIPRSSNAREGKFASTTRVCELSSQSNNNQRINGENNNQENNNRTLVQERQSRIQSSKRGTLEHDKTSFERGKIQQRDDNINKQRMDNVADTESISSYGGEVGEHQKESGEEGTTRIKTGRVNSDGANTDSERLQGQWFEHQLSESQGEEQIGWNGWWQFEPDVGRVAHGVPSRVDRLKGLGNSLVPYIPYLIGKTILKT